jgi:hypothetical protein
MNLEQIKPENDSIIGVIADLIRNLLKSRIVYVSGDGGCSSAMTTMG